MRHAPGAPVEVFAVAWQSPEGAVRHWQRGYRYVGEAPINPASFSGARSLDIVRIEAGPFAGGMLAYEPGDVRPDLSALLRKGD